MHRENEGSEFIIDFTAKMEHLQKCDFDCMSLNVTSYMKFINVLMLVTTLNKMFNQNI